MKTVKDKLYHFQENPPAGIWENISEKINQAPVIAIDGRRRTRRMAFITVAAAVIVILLINVVFVNKNESNQIPAVASSATDSVEKNNELLEAIIKAPENRKLLASRNVLAEGFMRYFTIEGPEGEPVKISPKVATLIISADNEYPPKPVWDKKIDEWQHIMLTNNMAPTAANLIEIIQQASNHVR